MNEKKSELVTLKSVYDSMHLTLDYANDLVKKTDTIVASFRGSIKEVPISSQANTEDKPLSLPETLELIDRRTRVQIVYSMELLKEIESFIS